MQRMRASVLFHLPCLSLVSLSPLLTVRVPQRSDKVGDQCCAQRDGFGIAASEPPMKFSCALQGGARRDAEGVHEARPVGRRVEPLERFATKVFGPSPSLENGVDVRAGLPALPGVWLCVCDSVREICGDVHV